MLYSIATFSVILDKNANGKKIAHIWRADAQYRQPKSRSIYIIMGAKNTVEPDFAQVAWTLLDPRHSDPEWNRLVQKLLNFKNMLKKQ